MAMVECLDNCIAHYERQIGVSAERRFWTGGRPLMDFLVAECAPATPFQPWFYGTAGMCASTLADPPIELHIVAKHADASLIELLHAVAHFHLTEDGLGEGHTVNFGRPWQAGSLCEFGYISRPYLFGPALEYGNYQPNVRHLWLVPITRAERDAKTMRGAEWLESALELIVVDVLDPRRASCV